MSLLEAPTDALGAAVSTAPPSVQEERIVNARPSRFLSRIRFVDELPADTERDGGPRQVFGACYSLVQPTPVKAPRLVAASREVAALLGYEADDLASEEFAGVFGGNISLPGMRPFAACYGGHQFGRFAGQLGDGRAITLGEQRGADGVLYELQLKGAGPTPYSRNADGRAVLRSSVREFLCSEAMHHLGVPTTRALSLVSTGDLVERDMFYDGRPALEPGAIVCRVAPSFLRFGNFEIFAARGDLATLKRLVGFSLRHYFPEIVRSSASDAELEALATPDAVAEMFAEVCRRTAALVVEWMRVGFVHGVMNTDNMSLLGLTIDYGPYGWLEDFDPNWTPNTTDAGGRRYRFGHQPRVAEWNLAQLAGALLPLVHEGSHLEAGLRLYGAELARGQAEMMARKLGLVRLELDPRTSESGRASDRALVDDLWDVLQLLETDMTIFYRALARITPEPGLFDADADRLRAPLEPAYYAPKSLQGPDGVDKARQIDAWLRRYVARAIEDRDRGQAPEERLRRMNAANPKFVLRNYLAQIAIDRATAGDSSEIEALLEVLRYPYDEQPGLERYAEKRPEWARSRAGCSMLSCSS